jgi:predicted DNA-binding transcriptional regulator AlpA
VSLTDLPSLDQIAADPARVRDLPADAAMDLYYRALAALAALGASLAKPGPAPRPSRSDEEGLIGPDEVAALIGLSVSWVEKHVRDLPERVSVLGNPRWRKRDVVAWLKARPRYGATP